jgi:hypothetical protein
MQNTAAEEESLKGVTISDDCFAKLKFVIYETSLWRQSWDLGENTP